MSIHETVTTNESNHIAHLFLVLHGVDRMIVEAGGGAGHGPVRRLRGDGAGPVGALLLHRAVHGQAREQRITVRKWK